MKAYQAFRWSRLLATFSAVVFFTACQHADDTTNADDDHSHELPHEHDNNVHDDILDDDALLDDTTELPPDDDNNTDENEQEPALPAQPWDIYAPGHYNVGYKSISLTYTTRVAEDERTLRVAIWYPTLESKGEAARYFQVWVRRQAFDNASVAHQNPMPVLVFSHGNGSLAEQNYFMAEYFASHGWIVAAPDHTNNTVADNEGRINLTSAVVRPQDISAVIDKLYDLPENHPVHGLASDDIILSGHSFGAFTTLATAGATFDVDLLLDLCDQQAIHRDYCAMFTPERETVFREGFLDERIRAAIPMTPGGASVFREGIEDISIPTLVFTGRKDHLLTNAHEGDPIWNRLQGEHHRRIDLIDGGHYTFSNMCEFLGDLELDELRSCGEGHTDPDTAFFVINSYSMAFARYHLFGDETNLDLINGIHHIAEDDVEFFSKATQ